MKDHLDARRLVIKEYNDRLGVNLTAVTEFNLDPSGEIGLNDVNSKILKIISKQPIDGYQIEDKRVTTQEGAGSFTQEIIFSLALGVTGNLAAEILKMIWKWARRNLRSKEKQANQDHAETIINIININFSPNSEVKVVNKNNHHIHLKDNEFKYEVTVENNGGIIYVKKNN